MNVNVGISGHGDLQGRIAAAELANLHDQFVNGEVPTVEVPAVETVKDVSGVVEVVPEPAPEKEKPSNVIDFSGKDFEETQKLLNSQAKINNMMGKINNAKAEKAQVVSQAFKTSEMVDPNDEYPNPDNVIQYHLDQWLTYAELYNYLNGDLKSEETARRINEFFTHPTTGEVLELVENPNVKSDVNELDFKRGLILYFKQNDEYLQKIDEEIEKMNAATEELNKNVSEALNPLKDNVLAYSEYLLKQSEPAEGDDAETTKKKAKNKSTAIAIRSAYTLENMIKLVEDKPNIKNNAMKDFKNGDRIREIGDRYRTKLKNSGIDFNLMHLLNDDPQKSLEYRALPKDDYPVGLENFTVFFIIRSLSMSLPDPSDKVFHAAIQVAYSQLLDGTIDSDVGDMIRRSVTKFLSYFA